MLYKRYRRAGAHRELARWARSVGWIAASVFRLGDSDVRRQWMHAVGLRVGRVIGSAEQRVFFP